MLTEQPENIMTSDFLDDVTWADCKVRNSQGGTIEPSEDGFYSTDIGCGREKSNNAKKEELLPSAVSGKRKRRSEFETCC